MSAFSPAYRAEADALDARVRAAIAGYVLDDAAFDRLACDICAHQLRWNAPYAAYARARGFSLDTLPCTPGDIPAVPAAAFKEAALSTAGEHASALWFETSGTTSGRGGRHYLESADLYDAALVAGFDRALLPDGARLRYLLLVADVRERPHSSLGYMMDRIAALRGDGRDGRYVHGDDLAFDAFLHDARAAIDGDVAVCIAATAFALVAVLDALDARGARLQLPAGSRIMETGGFKGRTRVVERDELYARAAARFGVPTSSIVAEYGMTELCSQYYDSFASRTQGRRIKAAPPWLRAIVVDAHGQAAPPGVIGAIRHIDCANRSSVVAVDTEDLGALTADGLVLIGRDRGAELRGCSLDAEDLAARA
ncbi:MAG: acyl-protein synthetase [Candidatus Velthaea sp.]